MEVGADAVLVNTAIAVARDPVGMARAFALATEAGRLGHLAGRGTVADATTAEASSPLTDFLGGLTGPTAATSARPPGPDLAAVEDAPAPDLAAAGVEGGPAGRER
jgi:thiazole synthase